jgi:hypothetical protein
MNGTDAEKDRIERLMKAACLPGPSDALKARVMEATQNAWRRDSIDIPARILLRRLVASAAAAVIVIALANRYSDRAVSPWQTGSVAVAIQEPFDLEALLESPHPVAGQHLIRLRGRQPSAIDASTLRGHVERVREILNETQGDGDSKSSTPGGARSRMVPTRPGFNSYS